MKSIILAAGKGTRMGDYTINCPKSLVKLVNIPILERQIATLKSVGINDITLITGYRSSDFDYLELPQIYNPDFDTTNMVQSLYCARKLFSGASDLIISYSDIIYERGVLKKLINNNEDISITIDTGWYDLWKIRMEDVLADAESLVLNSDQNIIKIGQRPKSLKEIEGQYIGLFKIPKNISKSFFSIYEIMLKKKLSFGSFQNVKNTQMTKYLQLLIDNGEKLKAILIKNHWLEIDTDFDLELYESLYKEDKLNKFCRID